MSALDELVTERDLQAQVVEIAKLHGWRVFHPWTSLHSNAGFPDLVLVRAPRVLFAELKRERGKVTPAQQAWLVELERCPGAECYVWRPSDRAQIAVVHR
jgi:hypothetical protein